MPTTDELIKARARQIVQEIEAKAQAEAMRIMRSGAKATAAPPKTPTPSPKATRPARRAPGTRWLGAEHAEPLSLALVDWLGTREGGAFEGNGDELLRSFRRARKFGRTPPAWVPGSAHTFGSGWGATAERLRLLGVSAEKHERIARNYVYKLRLPDTKNA